MKKNLSVNKSTIIYVSYDSHEESTRDPSSDDSWDRGDTYTSHEVTGLSLSENPGSRQDTLPVDFPVKAGDALHLLYAVYSTGDSFGHDENGGIEFILIYKTPEKAEKAKVVLEKVTSYGTTKIKTEIGKTLPFYVPWKGY